ncbi:MAG: tRNA (N(6)-L-threonylcarbamoyladenosine(37)-C(2))-methylthiotransferase MtaB [Candidatus Caldatribacteriota bacterium]|nr:tRNA (N(6)-L-threonylcarbamoyladenosine(37)-C(2))-methylthiotransferase MtaB [Candidatus Caldatribacteriota bacterium]
MKTLGCKVNQYETEALLNLFQEQSFQIVNFREKADIYIINTCTVTQEAERKSRQMIRRAIKQNGMAKIIVTGCSAQSCSPELREIEGINFILGNGEKNHILKYLQNTGNNFPVISTKPIKNVKKYDTLSKKHTGLHTRSLVKIQDGCNNFCTYCKVPYVRGPQRSRKPEDILKEIILLSEKGIKEIVLLGINLGTYGHDFSDSSINLAKLILLIIDHCVKIERIRLSSIEIINIDDELIDVFEKYPKMCPHLHIPLQSGSDKILRLMNRPYNLSFFSYNINKIRKRIPKIAITTDVMVGFPDEDENSFNHTYHYIKNIKFSKLHVFPYSDRNECLSNLLINKVDYTVKKMRTKRLLKLSDELFLTFREENIGKVKDILIESVKISQTGNLEAYGITDNYIKVCIPDFHRKKGDMVKVKISGVNKDYMNGVM